MKRFLLVLALLLPLPALADSQNYGLSVQGEASEDVAPDQVVLSMTILTKDVNLAAAKQASDALVNKLVAIARGLQISKEKIATTNVNINPEYQYTEGKQRFIGYQVSRGFRVTMDNLTTHEPLLQQIVDAKIDQVNGIEFKVADPEKRATALRIKAYADAKTKAEAMAQAAGIKLGAPLSIVIGDAPSPPGRPMPMFAAAKMADGGLPPSLPGLVNLRETVNVVFSIQ